MAARALGVKDLPPRRLLRIQPKFRIRFSALNVTRGSRCQNCECHDENERTSTFPYSSAPFVFQFVSTILDRSRQQSRFTMIKEEIGTLWQ